MKGIRNISVFWLSLFFIYGCTRMSSGVHSTWVKKPSPTVAVLPFSGESPFSEDLADALVTELLNHDFVVLERAQLDKIMGEHNLQFSGALAPAKMVQLGRLAGVDYLVVGSVTTRPVMGVIEYFFGDGFPSDQIDRVRLRWVSVENGQVAASVTLSNGRGGSMQKVAKNVAGALDRNIQTVSRRVEEIKDRDIAMAAKRRSSYVSR